MIKYYARKSFSNKKHSEKMIKIANDFILTKFFIIFAEPCKESEVACHHWIEVGYSDEYKDTPIVIDYGSNVYNDKVLGETNISFKADEREIVLFESMLSLCLNKKKIKKL